jgi:hypothetical protein
VAQPALKAVGPFAVQPKENLLLMNHADGWVISERRDVGLDGGRLTGGGPAGRRDQETVKEIMAHPGLA